jgi:hypothetical protein
MKYASINLILADGSCIQGPVAPNFATLGIA